MLSNINSDRVASKSKKNLRFGQNATTSSIFECHKNELLRVNDVVKRK